MYNIEPGFYYFRVVLIHTDTSVEIMHSCIKHAADGAQLKANKQEFIKYLQEQNPGVICRVTHAIPASADYDKYSYF